MTSPSVELIDDCYLYISGDVVIHPNAVIAPGVLLQADPGCRLTIESGVCVGQGSVLHAHGGSLEIAAGAILGSGVLIIGKAKIGSNACIGSLTTLINQSVDPNQLIPPHSLLGDTSRQIALTEPTAAPSVSAPASPPTAPASPPQKTTTKVYGQAYVERFMITMFPHRQSLNEPSELTNSDSTTSESTNNDTNGSSP